MRDAFAQTKCGCASAGWGGDLQGRELIQPGKHFAFEHDGSAAIFTHGDEIARAQRLVGVCRPPSGLAGGTDVNDTLQGNDSRHRRLANARGARHLTDSRGT